MLDLEKRSPKIEDNSPEILLQKKVEELFRVYNESLKSPDRLSKKGKNGSRAMLSGDLEVFDFLRKRGERELTLVVLLYRVINNLAESRAIDHEREVVYPKGPDGNSVYKAFNQSLRNGFPPKIAYVELDIGDDPREEDIFHRRYVPLYLPVTDEEDIRELEYLISLVEGKEIIVQEGDCIDPNWYDV